MSKKFLVFALAGVALTLVFTCLPAGSAAAMDTTLHDRLQTAGLHLTSSWTGGDGAAGGNIFTNQAGPVAPAWQGTSAGASNFPAASNIMGKVALLVVDMLNDFMDPKGVLSVGPQSRAIIPFVAQKAEEIRGRGGVVIFACDAHPPNDPEFRVFPPHALKGSWGAQLIPELVRQPGDYLVEKTCYSAFYHTNLDDILRQEMVREAHVVGVVTSICVLETVRGLYERDIPRLVYRHGVADVSPTDNDYGLDYMERFLGAKIVDGWGSMIPALNLLLLAAILPEAPSRLTE